MARERVDHTTWKAKTPADIEAAQSALPIHPPIWKKLRHMQRVCFMLGAQHQRFAFYTDMGTGKTLTVIALARYFKALGVAKHHLVLVERVVNKWEWAREIKKHTDTKFCILHGSSKEKWRQFERTDATLIIESYAGFLRMCCTTTITKRGKTKLKPDKAAMSRVTDKVKGLILDEVQNAGNHMKLPFRLCRAISKKAETVFVLTGTPFGRDPSVLWAQLFLVDLGKTLGETLGLFRAAFFNERAGRWATEYVFDRTKQATLNRFLANTAIRYEADAASLPRLVHVPKYISLPEAADAYYQKARETLIAAKGNYTECKNMFLRMRQISSGFVGFKDDDTGKKASYVFPDNPKLDLLLSIIGSIAEPYKVIVFHEFIVSGERIHEEVRKLGIGCYLVNGRTIDPRAVLYNFDHDAKARVLALNNSMATGLNLQIAKYGLYYESPVSPIVRKQSRRRFERQESKHKTVFLYDLIVRDTVDAQILHFHKTGEDLFRGIIDGKVTPR